MCCDASSPKKSSGRPISVGPWVFDSGEQHEHESEKQSHERDQAARVYSHGDLPPLHGGAAAATESKVPPV